mmetsp:Transcript_28949/g.75939  ORF Transcript_28949/g.75939 Transcript_28949/m.75939 type:complete len:215 (-) Transcript_28949:80-724(-)
MGTMMGGTGACAASLAAPHLSRPLARSSAGDRDVMGSRFSRPDCTTRASGNTCTHWPEATTRAASSQKPWSMPAPRLTGRTLPAPMKAWTLGLVAGKHISCVASAQRRRHGLKMMSQGMMAPSKPGSSSDDVWLATVSSAVPCGRRRIIRKRKAAFSSDNTSTRFLTVMMILITDVTIVVTMVRANRSPSGTLFSSTSLSLVISTMVSPHGMGR